MTNRDRALLGRQRSWPSGQYSTIAGFVEPCEDPETAVAREVLEEAGLEVSEVRYRSSQPWPFPSSLMLAFVARARGAASPLAPRDDELADVRWVTRSQVAAGEVAVPPFHSAAFQLIEDWYDRGGAAPLRLVPGLRIWA